MSVKLSREISYHSSENFVTGSFQAMAGPCELIVETQQPSMAKAIVELVAAEAWRIETVYSRYRDDNIIHQINHAKGETIEVDQETALLLDFADQCYQLSDGLFDITSGVLGKLWKFDGGCNIPSTKAVNQLLSFIGWDKVSWQKPYLTMPAGMALDFGGIGKEFAVDSAAKLVKAGFNEPVLINFGGDIYATKAPFCRDSWLVGIEPIELASKVLETNLPPKIQLKQGAVATSGDSKRYLTDHGKILSHVLNPKTGWPVANAPAAVTVMAETCCLAGMLATMAMLQGAQAENFLQEQQLAHWLQRRTND